MDAGRRWHQGMPPPDWWQAGDGRWHPRAPDNMTEELTVGSPAAGGHVPVSGAAKVWHTYRGWPRWARLTGPIAVSVLVVGVLGAAATGGLRERDDGTAATARATVTKQPGTSAPSSPGAATPAPTVGASTTTSAIRDSTTPPRSDPTTTTVATTPAPRAPPAADPSTNGIHRGASCSPEGATAFTGDGTSMVCTAQKCHGAPFSEPRWRRANC